MKKYLNKDIKFIIVFVIIVGISLLYLNQSSLAKYKKQVTGKANMQIAKWSIRVNNEDIANKTVLNKDITPQFEATSTTKESVIAPGSIGYFDIEIDPTNVDVNFKYELTTSVPESSTIKDLKIIYYIKEPDTNSTKIEYNDGDIITDTLEHNSETKKLRIYIEWDDSETNIMDNKADTEAATATFSKALINVNLKFSQINE